MIHLSTEFPPPYKPHPPEEHKRSAAQMTLCILYLQKGRIRNLVWRPTTNPKNRIETTIRAARHLQALFTIR